MGFWSNLFGWNQVERWTEFAQSMGATFTKGGWFSAHVVTWTHRSSTIKLDTYTVSNGKSSTTYTRIQAPLSHAPDFEFSITKRGLFSGLGDMLGMQRISINHPEVDKHFVIKGKPEAAVQSFLTDPDLIAQIAAQPSFDFSVKTMGGGLFGGVKRYELYFSEIGVIKDVQRLKQLFAIFALAQDRIEALHGTPATA